MKILWTAPRDFLPDDFFDLGWADVVFRLRSWRGKVNQPIYDPVDAWVVDPLQQVSNSSLLRMPELKVLATPSTGTNHIPLDVLEEYGIDCLSLTHDREALAEIRASSEHTFLLMLACLRRFPKGYMQLKAKRPRDERVFRGNELYQKKVGIIGLGRIGSNIRRWCNVFGADVVWYDPKFSDDGMSIQNIFTACDIIVLSLPLNNKTHRLVDEDMLNCMKQGAILINTSRGEIIDEEALIRVLQRRPDLRAGVDVLAGEVQGRHLASPLLEMSNVIATPHMAGCTFESQTKAANITLGLLKKWAQDQSNTKL